MITAEQIRKDYLSLTLPAIFQTCGGPDKTWAAYFNGEFDEELRNYFESMLNPQLRSAAFVLHGFIQELRSIHFREFPAWALFAMRDGIDTPAMHCDPVPAGSSWRYVIDRALENL